MKVKVSIHVEMHPGDSAATAGAEGSIVEFIVPRANLMPRAVVADFRDLVHALQSELQTPAKPGDLASP